MRYHKDRESGFTLLDVMVSAVLTVIIIAAAYNFYTTAKLTWAYSFAQGNMHREAALAIEKMIHGIDASHKGVAAARDIWLPAPGGAGALIQFEDSGTGGMTRQFYLQGDRLVYLDENNNTQDIIDGDVTVLSFARPAGRDNLVNIVLTMQRNVLGKAVSARMATSIELRNF